jgi:hypothetical protein
MSKATMSVATYGVYALFAGLGFLLLPDQILDLFGFEERQDHWILVVAILTLGLAYYYLASARANSRHFYSISWKGRLWFALATSTLVVLDEAPAALLMVGSVDFLTALWTAWALRQDAREGATT